MLDIKSIRVPGTDFKALAAIPGWAERMMENGANEMTVARAFAAVPLLYRCINLRCNALVEIPVHIMLGDKEVEWPFETPSLRDYLWRSEAAMLFKGAAYWQKNENALGYWNPRWLNPFATEPKYDKVTGLTTFAYRPNGASPDFFPEAEVVYVKEFHPSNDVLPGPGAAEVALADSQLQGYMTIFASQFFRDGAMPVMLIGVENASLSKDDQDNIINLFKRKVSGVFNAWKAHAAAFKGKINATPVTPPIKDMVIPELGQQTRLNLSAAFSVPQDMLENSAANYATASAHTLGFYRDTIRPRCHVHEDAANQQLFKDTDYRMVMAPEEMDIFQEDEQARATSLAQLTTAGMELSMAMAVLGYDIPEESVVEEYRKRLSPVQAPTNVKSVATLGAEADLRKWRAKSIKRFQEGKGADCGFDSDHIPGEIKSAVLECLGALDPEESAADDIKRIFALAEKELA